MTVVAHSWPKRVRTDSRNHAGSERGNARKPAWMLAFVVLRRRASPCPE